MTKILFFWSSMDVRNTDFAGLVMGYKAYTKDDMIVV